MSGAATRQTDRPHVLFAILDWGMGHATRTWPLIIAARRLGADITIATRGTAGQWIDARMAEWDSAHPGALAPWRRIEKPGVTIQYARGAGTLLRIAAQMPGYLASVSAERRWTRATVASRGITHVFSDNCYGCSPGRPEIPSVLLSHQLRLPVPALLRPLARAQVRRWARTFDAIWVPDATGSPLAGPLSHAVSAPTHYVGPLSRFQVLEPEAASDALDPDPPVLLGLVSGPEPQRSDMEAALRACFQRDGRPALILAGRPGGGERRDGHVLTVHDADDHRFRRAVLSAQHIVCRSGYSTLLDLVVLGRTATLVPTIGQPEQEDLAHLWQRQHGWPTLRAKDIADHTFPDHSAQPVSCDLSDPTTHMQRWLFPVQPTASPTHDD
ncbi:MAG: hypothetical protein CBC74_005745 [Crocinitomicaceae bacterium TMED114]|nr:MAG: hypothetical protein CBC74_005745 [Crocinitomicaceae bacterium TMED114]